MRYRHPSTRRSGKILVLFVFLVPALVGLLGLVIEGGLMMASHRQVQNAADAGALAAAFDRLRGRSTDTATTTATTFIQTHNGLSSATVTVNMPPASGPHAGSSQYVEVIVSYPVTTVLLPIVGVTSSQTVTARAVAGYEAYSAGEGVAVLDPTAKPGLTVGGGGTLFVRGRVIVNSQGAGWDENNEWVNLGMPQYAATTGNNSLVQARQIDIVGGVDVPANFQNIPGETGSPLQCRSLPEPDPLLNLPTPTTSNGVVNTYWSYNANTNTWSTAGQPQDINVSLSNGVIVNFSPGVYRTISITGGGPGEARFAPGIYVVGVSYQGGGTALNMTTTGGTVFGNGVMFYNTASTYDASTGLPDANDGDTLGSIPNNNMGSVNMSAPNINLTGITDNSSVFKGMLFYQRRWHTKSISIQGTANQIELHGTLYAKWAPFVLAGQGEYDAQFVAGSLSVSGQANITIQYAGESLGKANQVYLVE